MSYNSNKHKFALFVKFLHISAHSISAFLFLTHAVCTVNFLDLHFSRVNLLYSEHFELLQMCCESESLIHFLMHLTSFGITLPQNSDLCCCLYITLWTKQMCLKHIYVV